MQIMVYVKYYIDHIRDLCYCMECTEKRSCIESLTLLACIPTPPSTRFALLQHHLPYPMATSSMICTRTGRNIIWDRIAGRFVFGLGEIKGHWALASWREDCKPYSLSYKHSKILFLSCEHSEILSLKPCPSPANTPKLCPFPISLHPSSCEFCPQKPFSLIAFMIIEPNKCLSWQRALLLKYRRRCTTENGSEVYGFIFILVVIHHLCCSLQNKSEVAHSIVCHSTHLA